MFPHCALHWLQPGELMWRNNCNHKIFPPAGTAVFMQNFPHECWHPQTQTESAYNLLSPCHWCLPRSTHRNADCLSFVISVPVMLSGHTFLTFYYISDVPHISWCLSWPCCLLPIIFVLSAKLLVTRSEETTTGDKGNFTGDLLQIQIRTLIVRLHTILRHTWHTWQR